MYNEIGATKAQLAQARCAPVMPTASLTRCASTVTCNVPAGDQGEAGGGGGAEQHPEGCLTACHGLPSEIRRDA
jgi:hypothetical protein